MNAGSIPNYRATMESKAPKDLGFIQKRVDKPMMEYEVEGCQTTLRHMEMQIYHAYISISLREITCGRRQGLHQHIF